MKTVTKSVSSPEIIGGALQINRIYGKKAQLISYVSKYPLDSRRVLRDSIVMLEELRHHVVHFSTEKFFAQCDAYLTAMRDELRSLEGGEQSAAHEREAGQEREHHPLANGQEGGRGYGETLQAHAEAEVHG